MEIIKIDTTDIILQDFGNSKGKIIISDNDWDYNFSYYWGSMGKDTSLIDFLLKINSSYFVDKLSTRRNGDFSAKGTFKELRKYIREECSYELPWFKHMEFQKDMRKEINWWERNCGSEHEFVYEWDDFFKYTLNYYLIEDDIDRKDIESMFNGICEQWNFIVYDEPRENIWLKKLHGKLQKELKKRNKLLTLEKNIQQ